MDEKERNRPRLLASSSFFGIFAVNKISAINLGKSVQIRAKFLLPKKVLSQDALTKYFEERKDYDHLFVHGIEIMRGVKVFKFSHELTEIGHELIKNS